MRLNKSGSKICVGLCRHDGYEYFRDSPTECGTVDLDGNDSQGLACGAGRQPQEHMARQQS